MKENIDRLKAIYYSFLDEELSIQEFERYIYESEWIKTLIGDDQYLELISLDFYAKDIKYRLAGILLPVLGWADYQKKNVLRLLKKALLFDDDLPKVLSSIYDLYCDGYFFFQDLGLGYGLSCACPSIDGKTYDAWDQLSNNQKERILSSFQPQIKSDIERAINWLESDKIILLNKKNELNHMEYEDRRNEEEKRSIIWKIVGENKETGAIVSQSNIEIKKKAWWRRVLGI